VAGGTRATKRAVEALRRCAQHVGLVAMRKDFRLDVGFANGTKIGVSISPDTSPRTDVARRPATFDTLSWRTWACPHGAVGACGPCRRAHPGRVLDTLELVARFSDGRWR
jgi:hypothetical protein